MATSLMAWLNIPLKHTTLVGRVWLPVLFIMRVMTLLLAENSVWRNEESFFQCNTQVSGCQTVCFSKMNPVTHPQYWFFQLLLVTAPTLLWIFYFLTHPMLGAFTATEEINLSSESSTLNISSPTKSSKVSLPSKKYYILILLLKLVLEICFLVAQWFAIGFQFSGRYICRTAPCPHAVDCFYSNALNKNILIIVMATLTGVSILLLLLEFLLSMVKKTNN